MSRWKILLETCLPLAAALVSLAAVGLLPATTSAFGSRKCTAEATGVADRCACGSPAPAAASDLAALALESRCRTELPLLEARGSGASRPAAGADTDGTAREHGALILAGLFVAFRIAARRLRLYRETGSRP